MATDPLKAFVNKHKAVSDDKHTVSWTVYVSPSEAAEITEIQKELGCSRQSILRKLIQSGLVQYRRLK